jgi:hypothetical protein
MAISGLRQELSAITLDLEEKNNSIVKLREAAK